MNVVGAFLQRSEALRQRLTHQEARWTDQPRARKTIRLGNRALALAPRRRWTAGQLVDAARQGTGLYELGDEFFMPALEQLVSSIHDEAELTPLGDLIQRKRLTDLLRNRLRLEAEFRRRPELDDVALLPVTLIAGLQRTGTTLLHRLLASHPDTRALPSWECLSPAPLPGDVGDRKRRAIAKGAELGLRFIAPAFFAIHPVEAEAPEEEVLLLELSFMSQTGESIMRVPSYARWLEGQDQEPAYAYLVRVLKLLQERTPHARQWVLKSPNHLEWLDVVQRVMPGVHIVQTHRSPLATVPSFCSMVAHGRAIFSDAVDAREVGRHWLRKIARLTTRAAAVRAANDAAFIDLEYGALVADPGAEVDRLHSAVGWARGGHVARGLRQELARSKKGRFGRHDYRLADFGLDERTVRQSLAPYMAQHDY